MNSDLLKSKHKKVYEKFFQENELVVSVPLVMSWTGDVASGYIGISISQKLPLRIYIGVSFGHKKFSLGSIVHYDSVNDNFVVNDLGSYGSYYDKVKCAILEMYGELNVKISIFTECSQSVGLGFTSVFPMLLVATINLIKWNLNYEELNSELSCKNWVYIQESQSILNIIVSESIKMGILTMNKSGKTTKIASLLNGSRPVIGFGLDHPESYTNIDARIARKPLSYKIEELRDEVQMSEHMPFDFSILYSGNPIMIDKLSSNAQPFKSAYYNGIGDDLKKTFDPICLNMLDESKPKFYKYLIEKDPKEISNSYATVIGSISLEVLHAFKELLSIGYSELTLYQFIAILNRYKSANMLTKSSGLELLNFLNKVEDFLYANNEKISIFPNDTTLSGGCVTVISPLEQVRKRLYDFVDSYGTNTTDRNPSVIYTSRLDGVETEGMKIEQDLRNNIYSNFSMGFNYKLINRDGSAYLRTYQDAINDRQNDLLVDTIKGKIYINGEVCTSNELHSQSTTVELLTQIFEKGVRCISCKMLSPSSYVKSKNEMITKVINPFVKLIEQRFGKLIIIDCNGYVSDYTIELDLKDLRVGFIKGI